MEIASLIFGTIAFVFSVINFIELRASKLSTHSVQYIDPFKEVDVDREMNKINEQIKSNNFHDDIV